jgi:anti-sigma factor ChrR (cupin superfamily)
LPTEYICIDPEEATQLFDYLNGAGGDVDKEAAAAHLGLCFSCQDAVARRRDLNRALLEAILV